MEATRKSPEMLARIPRRIFGDIQANPRESLANRSRKDKAMRRNKC